MAPKNTGSYAAMMGRFKKKPPPAKFKQLPLKLTTAASSMPAMKTPDPPIPSNKSGDLPRIHQKLLVKDLKEEAIARGIANPPKTKAGLMDVLVDGSIHLKETPAWKEIERLKDRMEQEKPGLVAKMRVQQREKFQKAEQRRIAKEQKEEAAKKALRQEELESQKAKHTHSFPNVHPCKLAVGRELNFKGTPRSSVNVVCTECKYEIFHQEEFYTCEKCDFDICSGCFKYKNMTPQEKEALRKAKEKERKMLRRQQEEQERQWALEEERRRAKYDEKQFKPCITNPPAKNKKPDGNKLKGYTVWCSDGFEPDGWHSYEGPPAKEFDATYKTKADANARAKYLFYWHNSYGLDPDELTENAEEFEESESDGLVTFRVHPADSSVWTVGVVPDAAFQHLENATTERHNYCMNTTKPHALQDFLML